MGKFLKVLVVFLLLLSIATLALGILLFMKRETLKGRTQRLEKTIFDLDTVIEEIPGTKPVTTYTEMDISPCDAMIPDPVEFNDFWTKDYKHPLEATEGAKMVNTTDRKLDLMTYIFVNPDTGEKRIKGPGTMDEVLKDLYAKAEAQYALLNTTRLHLVDTRKELIRVIEAHNQKKMDHRQALIKIKELEETIVQLKARIAELENKVAELESLVSQLRDQIAELEAKVVELEEELEETKKELETLKERRKATSESPLNPIVVGPQKAMEPGIKGEIVLVNQEWQIVIFKATDELITELTGEDPEAPIPQMDFWVKRKGKQTVVSKVRLISVKREQKLVTCDILKDWQQEPLKEGDVIFHQ